MKNDEMYEDARRHAHNLIKSANAALDSGKYRRTSDLEYIQNAKQKAIQELVNLDKIERHNKSIKRSLPNPLGVYSDRYDDYSDDYDDDYDDYNDDLEMRRRGVRVHGYTRRRPRSDYGDYNRMDNYNRMDDYNRRNDYTHPQPVMPEEDDRNVTSRQPIGPNGRRTTT